MKNSTTDLIKEVTTILSVDARLNLKKWVNKTEGAKTAGALLIDTLWADNVRTKSLEHKDFVESIKSLILETKYTAKELVWLNDKSVKQAATYPAKGKNFGRTKKSMRDGATSGYLAEIKRQLESKEAAAKQGADRGAAGADKSKRKPTGKQTKRSPYQIQLDNIEGVIKYCQGQEGATFDITKAVTTAKELLKIFKTKKETK